MRLDFQKKTNQLNNIKFFLIELWNKGIAIVGHISLMHNWRILKDNEELV